MAVPSSGPLELRGDINLEVNGNVTDTNVALHQLSIDAGFSTPDAMSDFYGYSSVVAPTMVTKPSTSITQTTMTINGCVSDTGGQNVSRGFYFGTNSSSATSNTKYQLGGTQGTGDFSCGRSGLSSGTAYYVWAWGCNSAGESFGNRCTSVTSYPPYTPPPTTNTILAYARTCVNNYGPTTFDGQDNQCSCLWQCQCIRMGYLNPYNGAQVQEHSATNTFCDTLPAGGSAQYEACPPNKYERRCICNYIYYCSANFLSTQTNLNQAGTCTQLHSCQNFRSLAFGYPNRKNISWSVNRFGSYPGPNNQSCKTYRCASCTISPNSNHYWISNICTTTPNWRGTIHCNAVYFRVCTETNP